MGDLRSLLLAASPPDSSPVDVGKVRAVARRRRRVRRGVSALGATVVLGVGVALVWPPLAQEVVLVPADGLVTPLPADGVVESGADWELSVTTSPTLGLEFRQGRMPGIQPYQYRSMSSPSEYRTPYRLKEGSVYVTDASAQVETLVVGPVEPSAASVEVTIADEVHRAALYSASDAALVYVLRLPGRHMFDSLVAYDADGVEIDRHTLSRQPDVEPCSDDEIRTQAVTWEQQLESALAKLQQGGDWRSLADAVGVAAGETLERCSLDPAARQQLEAVAAVDGGEEALLDRALVATVMFTRPCPLAPVQQHVVQPDDLQPHFDGGADGGSTMFFLADVLYGDGRLGELLAEVNGIGPDDAPVVGDTLVVPPLPGCGETR